MEISRKSFCFQIKFRNFLLSRCEKLLTLCFRPSSELVLCYFCLYCSNIFSFIPFLTISRRRERANFLIISIADPKRKSINFYPHHVRKHFKNFINLNDMPLKDHSLFYGSNQVIQLWFNKYYDCTERFERYFFPPRITIFKKALRIYSSKQKESFNLFSETLIRLSMHDK